MLRGDGVQLGHVVGLGHSNGKMAMSRWPWTVQSVGLDGRLAQEDGTLACLVCAPAQVVQADDVLMRATLSLAARVRTA